MSYLDGTLLQHFDGQRRLVEHNLSVHHVVDGFTLYVGVKDLMTRHLVVERIPNLVPGYTDRNGTEENLLGHRPTRINLGTSVEL